MALCPAGHESQTTDYCDTCGAVMGGAAGTSAPAGPSAAAAAGGSCPQCGADRGGRFCEECGYDYELAELVPARTPDPLAQTAAMPPDYDFDAEFEKAEREFAASGNAPEASQAPTLQTSPPTPSTASTVPPRLTAVVIADREYYAAQVERGDIVEAEFPFPKYPGERRFPLDGDRIRIGRASASRGIAVEIDLTGPPLDPAVSHLHAQLLRGPDGFWSLVDLDSANGTRLNGAAQPLAAETEVPVGPGDRIHLGVWTTLILEEVR